MMTTVAVCLVLALAGAGAAGDYRTYEGYQLWHARPTHQGHHRMLDELREAGRFDFWGDDDILVSRDAQPELKNFLQKASMTHDVTIRDVGELVTGAYGERDRRVLPRQSTLDWAQYHPLEVIEEFVGELRARPWVSVRTAGMTLEGRTIEAVHFNPGRSKRRVFIQANLHAREWVTSAAATYILEQLINRYESNKALVNAFDWHVLPLVNKDGFVFSWTHDRLWRKNRRLPASCDPQRCYGVDLNRNFNASHQRSADTCSEIYAGTKSFSEPETRAVRDYTLKHGPWDIVLDLHSYGQLFLHPYGYTQAQPRKVCHMEDIGSVGVAAIKSASGKDYQVGSTANLLYNAYGTAIDWFYDEGLSPLPLTVELRDQGTYGFLLPPDQITATAEELFAAMRAMLKAL